MGKDGCGGINTVRRNAIGIRIFEKQTYQTYLYAQIKQKESSVQKSINYAALIAYLIVISPLLVLLALIFINV